MSAKYIEIAAELRRDIAAGKYPPDSLLPTEQQLSEIYGTSRQTVRHALTYLVEQNLIQRRQGSGSKVLGKPQTETDSRKTVAVVTTYISNYIFPGILREIELTLSANSCTMQLYATSNQVHNERKILNGLLERKLDGLLVEGTKTALPNPNLDLYQKLKEKGIPIVFFNGFYRDLSGCTVIQDDNFGGGRQLVNYLVSKGHRHIAGIFKSDDIQGHERYAGYAAGLKDNRLAMDDSKIFWYGTENKPAMGALGDLWAQQVLPVLQGCTAVVCYNDEAAIALTQYLLSKNVKIPEELAVVSFDNSHYSDMCSKRITSLSHGSQNQGKIAAEALLEYLNGGKPSSQTVPWVLAEKETS